MTNVIRVSRIEKPTAIQLTRGNAKEVAAFIRDSKDEGLISVRAGGGWVKIDRGVGEFTLKPGTWAIVEHGRLFFLWNEDFKRTFRKLK